METRICNKTRIWNTFAEDQEVFHIRVYTVLQFANRHEFFGMKEMRKDFNFQRKFKHFYLER